MTENLLSATWGHGMVERLAFRDVGVVDAKGFRDHLLLVLDGGRILSVETEAGQSVDAKEVDAGGMFLVPGFIDLHIHGAMGLLAERSQKELEMLSRALPNFGVTSFLPALTPCSDDASLLKELSKAKAPGAHILGFLLEGHFLALGGAIKRRRQYGSEMVCALIEAARPYRVVFAVSPELDGVEGTLNAMSMSGLPVFITHTCASAGETFHAIELGARHATHFYDVFPYPGEREPGVRGCGVVEAVLIDPRISVDFILDGVHVDPVSVKLALRCKGYDDVSLITDANIAAGLGPGTYRGLGDLEILVEYAGGPAREKLDDASAGGLAGSGLTMNKAVRNAVEMLGCTLPQAIGMATYSPAKVLGIESRKGLVKQGYDADLVLLNESLEVTKTFVAGREVYAVQR